MPITLIALHKTYIRTQISIIQARNIPLPSAQNLFVRNVFKLKKYKTFIICKYRFVYYNILFSLYVLFFFDRQPCTHILFTNPRCSSSKEHKKFTSIFFLFSRIFSFEGRVKVLKHILRSYDFSPDNNFKRTLTLNVYIRQAYL